MNYRLGKKQARLVQLSPQLSALSNASRVQILLLLCDGELSVGTLSHVLGLSQSALSQHLRKLKQAGAVNVRREAQWRFYSLNEAFLDGIMENLQFFVQGVQPEKPMRFGGLVKTGQKALS